MVVTDAKTPETAIEDEAQGIYDSICGELASLLGVDRVPGATIVLCPSGTDAELIALALVKGNSEQSIVNIVTGPTEVGSGSVLAAGGRHFDETLPGGGGATKGAPLQGEL